MGTALDLELQGLRQMALSGNLKLNELSEQCKLDFITKQPIRHWEDNADREGKDPERIIGHKPILLIF